MICFARLNRLHAALMLFLAFLLTGAQNATAQTAHFSYAQSIVTDQSPNNATLSPNGVAVDASGNVYIAEASNNQVLKVPWTGTSYGTPTVLLSGLNNPWGVAVDASENVYVTDSANNQILSLPWTGSSYGTPTVLLSGTASGLKLPRGIAVDSSGNVYIGNTYAGNVLKMSLTNGVYGTPTIVATGLGEPYGVAVDGSGNVYTEDPGNSRVLKVPFANGVYGTPTTVETGNLTLPHGGAVDGSGDLFISNGHRNQVVNLPWDGSSYAATSTILTSDVKYPMGVAIDGSGDLYVADRDNDRVLKLQTVAVDFLSEPVASTSATQALTFTFDTGATIEAPVVRTQGVTGKDFADAGTGTCTTNGTSHSYAAGDTCTVVVSFTPSYPGQRTGAVQLLSSNGAVIATGNVHGKGTGPLVAFDPAVQSVATTGYPEYIAVDGDGNLYITNSHDNTVVKAPWTGSAYGAQVVVATGLNQPKGIAIDGGGNIYVADSGSNQVIELPWTGTKFGAQTVLLSSLDDPWGVAVDGSGNVYVTEVGNKNIVKLPWTGSGYGPQVVLANGLTLPYGVAVDSSWNVYIADAGNGQVSKYPWKGSSYGTQTVIASGLSLPQSVAVDGIGNVYIADTGSNHVLEYPWTGNSYGTQTVLASGLNAPQSVAVDAKGNFYIASSGNGQVLKEDMADAPTLSFPTTTNAGTTDSTDGVQSLTVSNHGNAPLTAITPGLVVSANFTETSGGGTPEDCTATFSLAQGEGCNLSIEFTPGTSASGALSGSVVLTDNNLNASPSTTQTIVLNGTAVQPPTITVTPGTLPPGIYGSVYTSTTFEASGGTAPYTYSASSVPAGLKLSSSGVLSGTASATGTFILTVTATDSLSYTGTRTYSVVIATAPLTITATNTSRTYGSANPTFAGTVVGAVNGDTFAESFSTPALVTSAVGTYAIAPTVTGTNLANYTVTPTNGTLTVVRAATTTNLSASSSQITPGTSVTLTAQVVSATSGTPTGTVNFYDGTTLLGAVPLTNGTATYTTTGAAAGMTHTLKATYSGDTDFAISSSSSDPLTVASLGFTFTSTGTTSRSVLPGTVASYTFAIAPLYQNYGGTVSFTVDGLPTGATAVLSPSSIAANGGAMPVTMTVTTASLTAKLLPDGQKLLPLSLALLFLPPFSRLRQGRKKLARMLSVVALLIGGAGATALLNGCGSNNGFFGQPEKSYTITVTATAGDIQHSAAVTLNLQ